MFIGEVAEKLGVSPDTIRRWELKFNISVPLDSRNRKKYSEEHFQLLQKIKGLREQENGTNTIIRKLGLGYADHDHMIGKDHNDANSHDMHMVSNHELKRIEESLNNRLDSIIDMSEKLSRASYEIGTLKERNANLEEKMKLISDNSSKDVSGLQKEIEKLKLDKNEEIQKLKSELEKEKQKPWYKKLFSN